MPGFHWSIVPTTLLLLKLTILHFYTAALLYNNECTILLFDTSQSLLQCSIWLLSHVLLQQCSALEVFGDTCLFVALFVPHMWHHPLPALRQIKAFILRFVKSTNQCLFSPFVLICEWDIIPNFADMSGETRRGHLCRIETENYWKSENPDCGPQKSPDARFASEPQKCFVENCGLGFIWGASTHVFPVNASSFIRWRKMNMIRVQRQRWAGHMSCSTSLAMILSDSFSLIWHT